MEIKRNMVNMPLSVFCCAKPVCITFVKPGKRQ
jgi:hypothetical protein